MSAENVTCACGQWTYQPRTLLTWPYWYKFEPHDGKEIILRACCKDSPCAVCDTDLKIPLSEADVVALAADRAEWERTHRRDLWAGTDPSWDCVNCIATDCEGCSGLEEAGGEATAD